MAELNIYERKKKETEMEELETEEAGSRSKGNLPCTLSVFLASQSVVPSCALASIDPFQEMSSLSTSQFLFYLYKVHSPLNPAEIPFFSEVLVNHTEYILWISLESCIVFIFSCITMY